MGDRICLDGTKITGELALTPGARYFATKPINFFAANTQIHRNGKGTRPIVEYDGDTSKTTAVFGPRGGSDGLTIQSVDFELNGKCYVVQPGGDVANLTFRNLGIGGGGLWSGVGSTSGANLVEHVRQLSHGGDYFCFWTGGKAGNHNWTVRDVLCPFGVRLHCFRGYGLYNFVFEDVAGDNSASRDYQFFKLHDGAGVTVRYLDPNLLVTGTAYNSRFGPLPVKDSGDPTRTLKDFRLINGHFTGGAVVVETGTDFLINGTNVVSDRSGSCFSFGKAEYDASGKLIRSAPTGALTNVCGTYTGKPPRFAFGMHPGIRIGGGCSLNGDAIPTT